MTREQKLENTINDLTGRLHWALTVIGKNMEELPGHMGISEAHERAYKSLENARRLMSAA